MKRQQPMIVLGHEGFQMLDSLVEGYLARLLTVPAGTQRSPRIARRIRTLDHLQQRFAVVMRMHERVLESRPFLLTDEEIRALSATLGAFLHEVPLRLPVSPTREYVITELTRLRQHLHDMLTLPEQYF